VEHIDELIAARALYALGRDEVGMVAAHLAECDRCRLQLREMEEVAATLALAAPPAPPPPKLRERLLGAVEPVATAPIPPAPSVRRFARWPRIAAVAVPVLACAVIALIAWNVSLRGQVAGNRVAAVTPIGNVGSAVSLTGGGVVLVGSLAPAPAGHVYEAWVIGGGGTPRPAGVFKGGRPLRFTLTRGAHAGDTIAITLELGNGGSSPQGPRIAAGRLA